MPATINPSLWRGAAGLAASLGLCNLAPDVRAGSAKTKGRDQAPQIDRPHRLDVGGGINKSTRANLHPGYAAVQRLIDHNAALKKKEFVGQKYKYCDMQRAAADHGLTIGKVTLAKMVKDDPSVGLRPGQARLLPPQAEKDLATVFTCAQESGVARAQGWLAQSIGDLSKGQENQARESAQTRNKSPDELMSMPRPNRQAARGLMARQDLWNKKHKAVDAKHAGLLVSEVARAPPPLLFPPCSAHRCQLGSACIIRSSMSTATWRGECSCTRTSTPAGRSGSSGSANLTMAVMAQQAPTCTCRSTTQEIRPRHRRSCRVTAQVVPMRQPGRMCHRCIIL